MGGGGRLPAISHQPRMKLWVVFIRADDRYWLLAQNHSEDEGRSSVCAFPSEKAATDHFEAAYNRNHDRGYEASMSACINYMTYQPSVVGPIDDSWRFVSKKPARSWAFNELISTNGKMHTHQLSHVSGFVLAHLCDNQELVAELWSAGKKPALITPA